MSYKAFQDWYHESSIKHLLLYPHCGYLISPPFGTEKCKDYNKIMKYDGKVSYIDTNLSSATSKTNCIVEVNGTSWFIPYAIYDSFNEILELKNNEIKIHSMKGSGRGQFYSGASSVDTAFSFPLGYEGTKYCLYIKNNIPTLIPFDSVEKAHMGTVYCNGKYYSMPRGDVQGYNNLVSFDGENFKSYYVPVKSDISRKFSDIVVVGNKLYSLPYGEQAGICEAVEFDTITEKLILHKLNIPDFAKKFNCMVKVGSSIIGLPYGSEHTNDSNYGIVFNTETKESSPIDIKIYHGGKYRFRCGVEFNNNAVFFPSGTPQCPIIVISEDGNIQRVIDFKDYLFGRPIVFKNKIHILGYHIINETHHLFIFDNDLNYTIVNI